MLTKYHRGGRVVVFCLKPDKVVEIHLLYFARTDEKLYIYFCTLLYFHTILYLIDNHSFRLILSYEWMRCFPPYYLLPW